MLCQTVPQCCACAWSRSAKLSCGFALSFLLSLTSGLFHTHIYLSCSSPTDGHHHTQTPSPLTYFPLTSVSMYTTTPLQVLIHLFSFQLMWSFPSLSSIFLCFQLPLDSLALSLLLAHAPTTAALGPSSGEGCQEICQGGWGDNWGKGGGANAWMQGTKRPGGQPGFPRPLWQKGVGLN